jgi:hypothetical protein
MEQQKKIDLLSDRLIKRANFKREFESFMCEPSIGWRYDVEGYNMALETKKARLYIQSLAINEQFKQIVN